MKILKKRLLSSAAVGVLAGFSPAMAAPPSASPAQIYTWAGFYIGGNFGYSWGSVDNNYTEPAFACSGCSGLPTSISNQQRPLDGMIGGGQIGYNWQIDNAAVVGIEADFQGSTEKANSNNSYPYSVDCEGCTGALTQSESTKLLWFGTVRGRIGPLVNPTTWLYATGGLAYGRINVSGTFTDTLCTANPPTTCSWSYGEAVTKVGWTVGAGVESMVPNAPGWTWKLEYLFINLGSVSGTGYDTDFQGPYTWSANVTDNILRVGLNYKFH